LDTCGEYSNTGGWEIEVVSGWVQRHLYYFQKCSNFQKTLFSEIFFLKERKESDEIFKNKPFFEMGSSKLIDYLTNMCQSGQGTTITATSSRTSIYEGR
jgi:dynactin complex subunit